MQLSDVSKDDGHKFNFRSIQNSLSPTTPTPLTEGGERGGGGD